jgi:hypothetical protein
VLTDDSIGLAKTVERLVQIERPQLGIAYQGAARRQHVMLGRIGVLSDV